MKLEPYNDPVIRRSAHLKGAKEIRCYMVHLRRRRVLNVIVTLEPWGKRGEIWHVSVSSWRVPPTEDGRLEPDLAEAEKAARLAVPGVASWSPEISKDGLVVHLFPLGEDAQ